MVQEIHHDVHAALDPEDGDALIAQRTQETGRRQLLEPPQACWRQA
jgi:hypothetical protein